MAFQPGDIISFAKAAWELYQLGWSEDLNATTQYLEFGRDVRNLASGLDILTQVVSHAQSSLIRTSPAPTAAVGYPRAAPRLRWDPVSLREIIGDYEETLNECRVILHENRRYAGAVGAVRNIEWNLLVRSRAERLRARIVLHNSKVLHVLKPFEIDLLCRLRHDIHRMHAHITQHLHSIQTDLRTLIGILVPDLERELHQQTQRAVQLVRVPDDVAARFAQASVKGRETHAPDMFLPAADPSLQELADAFVIHYDNSTANFVGGLLVETRVAPVRMWISLLKCAWIMGRMKTSLEAAGTGDESHWPSYVRQLEMLQDLSDQCRRVGTEVIEPPLETATPDMFDVWPERPLPELVDVVTKDEFMELILDVPIRSSSQTVERSLKLLRRSSSSSTSSSVARRFRVIISGTDQSPSPPRRQVETIDFDLRSVLINPLYAAPSSSVFSIPEMVLRRDERIAKLAFESYKDLFRLQQGISGWKVWMGASHHNVVVNFVISGRKDPIREKACVQLWTFKPLKGRLVRTSDLQTPPSTPVSPAPSLLSPARSCTQFSASTNQTAPPAPPGPRAIWSITGLPFSSSPPRRPALATPPPARAGTLQSPGGWVPSVSLNPPTSPLPGRSMSISSETSTVPGALSVASNSSTSETHTVTVALGDGSGTLYETPPNPLLVIFTRNLAGAQKPAVVVVRLDQRTAVNPERCSCWQSGRDGTACPMTSIEQNKGRDNLVARRFESRDSEWNLAEVAAAVADGGRTWGRGSGSGPDEWRNLRRVSFLFEGKDGPANRAVFGGTPNKCKCEGRREGDLQACIREGHRGHIGHVQDQYRKQMNEHYRVRYEERRQVVNGCRDDAR